MRKSIRGNVPGIALFVASVTFLFAASCNLPDLPFLSNEKSAIEPDSTRGDSTFYHYTVRYPDTTKVEIFATFDGVWNMYRPHWVGGTLGTTYWVEVSTWVDLVCENSNAETVATADELIRKAGHTVNFRTLNGYHGLPSYSLDIALGHDWVPSTVPLLENLRAYDERPDIFRYVYPVRRDSDAKASGNEPR